MSQWYTEIQPSHKRIYTVVYSLGYCSKKFLCEYFYSSVHVHGTKSEVEILNILKLL